MANASIFITATEARQNPVRESVIHDEARAIESAILDAVKNGFYQTTVSSGSPMTGSSSINAIVTDVDLITNALLAPDHPFKTGDIVTVTSNGTLPAPLVSTAYYSIIYIDPDHIKLAASPSDATNVRPIDIDFTVGVTDYLINNHGSGYLTQPSVYIQPPAIGNSATAVANMYKFGTVDNINVVSAGAGYTTVPSVSIEAPGAGAVAGNVWFTAVSADVATMGVGYRIGDILQCWPGLGGGSTTVSVTSVDATGSVTGIRLIASSEYDSLVSITNLAVTPIPSGGSGCTLNLTMGIAKIAVATGGMNYVVPPIVTITSASGSGAKANAIITAGQVSGFQIVSKGSGYISAPTISLSSGTGATAIAHLQPTGVGAITVLNNGNGSYTTAPVVTITAQGDGAVVNTVKMKIVSAAIASIGGGYRKGDILLVAGGAGSLNASIQVTQVGSLGEILSYTLTTSGSYTFLPILNNNSVIGGSGNSATFNLKAGLDALTIVVGGSGYTVAPTVIITPADGNGSGASAYAMLLADVVSSLTVTSSGTGYTTVPIVTISSGSDATATAIVNAGSITEIVVTSAGSNYTSTPIVTIEGSATAYASLKPTGISRIEVTDPGEMYTSKPSVQVINGPNNAATSVQPATVVNLGYGVESLTITNSGSGYGSAPDITIAEPTGMFSTPAIATLYTSVGSGSMVVSLYQNSRDYYKVWKNQAPSDALYVRPYQERMDTVVAYFTNMGYTINRQTNPSTGNTIQWLVMW